MLPLLLFLFMYGTQAATVCEDVDLVFVMDSSASVREENFNQVKRFLSMLALQVPQANRRVAAVLYSPAKTEFSFKTYAGADDSTIEQAILSLPFKLGTTETGLALDYVRTKVVGKQGDRPEVQNVILVITDGASSDDPGAAADRLRAEGHKVIALGIKDAVDSQLLAIAGSQELLFHVDDYSSLDNSLKDQIASETCPPDPTTIPPTPPTPVTTPTPTTPSATTPRPTTPGTPATTPTTPKTNINECELGLHDCGSSSICIDTPGSYTCVCKTGFMLDDLTKTCGDIDECQLRLHDCHNNAECYNTVGSYSCVCKPGFSGDGHICEDIDECDNNIPPCDENVQCINTLGSYKCNEAPVVKCNGKWIGPTPVRGDILCLETARYSTWKEVKDHCKGIGATLPRLPTREDSKNYTYRRMPSFSEADIMEEITYLRGRAVAEGTAFASHLGYAIDYVDHSKAQGLGSSILTSLSKSSQTLRTSKRRLSSDPLGSLQQLITNPVKAVQGIFKLGKSNPLQAALNLFKLGRSKRQAQLGRLTKSAKKLKPRQDLSNPQTVMDPNNAISEGTRLGIAPPMLLQALSDPGAKLMWENSDGGLLETAAAADSFSAPTQPTDILSIEENCLFLWGDIDFDILSVWKIHDGYCDTRVGGEGFWIHDWPTMCRVTQDQYCRSNTDPTGAEPSISDC